jgi:hypothetical protein
MFISPQGRTLEFISLGKFESRFENGFESKSGYVRVDSQRKDSEVENLGLLSF